jgi:hypothetical protein
MHFDFPSLTRKDVYYRVETEWSVGSGHSRNTSVHFKEFSTYGDGQVQHSPASGLSIDNFADNLFSLADHLIKNPADRLTTSSVWPHRWNRPCVWFARTIKYSAGKTRYYSFEEQKVSSAEAKRHDKRYHEIPEWADGEAWSAYRLIAKEFDDGLAQLGNWAAVRDHASSNGDHSPYAPHDWPLTREMHVAFDLVNGLVDAYDHEKRVPRSVECHVSNTNLAREMKEEVA